MPTPATTGRATTKSAAIGRAQGGAARGGPWFWAWLPLILGAGLWLGVGAIASLYAAWGDAWVAAADSKPGTGVERLDLAQWAYGWATRLDPLHPDYRQGLARVLETRGAALPPGDPEARALFTQALTHYRTAARARPSWPYTWVALARVKARLGAVDADFDAAYGRACERGRWDPKVQALILDLGLPLWRLLSPQARELTLGALARGLVMQPGPTLASAVGAGRLDLVAPLVAGDSALEALLQDATRVQPGQVARGSGI